MKTFLIVALSCIFTLSLRAELVAWKATPMPGAAYDVDTADFNRDGKMDVLLWDSDDGKVIVGISTGDGAFLMTTVWHGASSSARARDINGDGLVDIVVVASADNVSSPSFTYLLLQNGDGTFAENSAILFPPTLATYKRMASFLDVNEDGILDIVINDLDVVNARSFWLSAGTPTGTREPWVTVRILDERGVCAPLGFVQDVTGDGHLDSILADGRDLVVYPGLGVLAFGAPIRSVNPANLPSTHALELEASVGDANGDGVPDFGVAVKTGTRFESAGMLISTGSGHFRTYLQTSNVSGTAVNYGDLDGDRVRERHWSYFSGLPNQNTLSFAEDSQMGRARGCAFGDFDGDGDADAVVIDDFGFKLRSYRNDRAPTSPSRFVSPFYVVDEGVGFVTLRLVGFDPLLTKVWAEHRTDHGQVQRVVDGGEVTWRIPIVADRIYENTETFEITAVQYRDPNFGISLPNEIVHQAVAVLAILDDDSPPQLKITSSPTYESRFGGEAASARFEFRLSSVSGQDCQIDCQVEPLTASRFSDFRASAKTQVVVRAGSLVGFVDVPLVADDLAEAPEQFQLRVSRVEGALFQDGPAVTTILDGSEPLAQPGHYVSVDSDGAVVERARISPSGVATCYVFHQQRWLRLRLNQGKGYTRLFEHGFRQTHYDIRGIAGGIEIFAIEDPGSAVEREISVAILKRVAAAPAIFRHCGAILSESSATPARGGISLTFSKTGAIRALGFLETDRPFSGNGWLMADGNAHFRMMSKGQRISATLSDTASGGTPRLNLTAFQWLASATLHAVPSVIVESGSVQLDDEAATECAISPRRITAPGVSGFSLRPIGKTGLWHGKGKPFKTIKVVADFTDPSLGQFFRGTTGSGLIEILSTPE